MKIDKELQSFIEKIIDGKRPYHYDYGPQLIERSNSLVGKKARITKLLGMSMSLGANFQEEHPFGALIVLADGRRSLDTMDFSERDWRDLKCIAETNNLYPSELMARVNDLLWTYRKDHLAGAKAVTAYLSLADETFDDKEWVTCFEFIKRAHCVARSLGRSNSSFHTTSTYIDGLIERLNGSDPSLLSVSLIGLAIDTKLPDLKKYTVCVDNLIQDVLLKDSILRLENVYELKIRLAESLHDSYLKQQTSMEYAQQLENYALEKSRTQLPQGIHFYEKALMIYKKHKQYDCVKRLSLLLDDLKLQRAKSMPYIEQKIDLTEYYKLMDNLIKDHTLMEQLVILSYITRFSTKAELEERVLKNQRHFLSQTFFPPVYLIRMEKLLSIFLP